MANRGLAHWLDENGMSQVALARAIDVHESVISRAVNERRQPSADLWRAFGKVFGFDVAEQVFSSDEANAEAPTNEQL